MSSPSCPSPPPPLPSPVLVPAPLPFPPPKHSRRHVPTLHRSTSSDNPHRLPPPRTIKRAASHLPLRCRSPPPRPAVRSPPPPVPPIPAFVRAASHSFIRPSIPNRATRMDLYLDRPPEDSANVCCGQNAGGPLTCTQFFAVHNPKGRSQA